MNEASQIRELFIDELEQVNGGGPIEEVVRKVTGGEMHTTYACCEEGPDGCCPSPIDWS